MLSAEDPLDVLIDRLRRLPVGDRHAVLARLAVGERGRIEAALRAPYADAVPGFAPDISARITAPAKDGAMTSATREVLRRVAGRHVAATEAASASGPSPPPSLIERLGAVLRRR